MKGNRKMNKQHFNLVTEPWIKVIDNQNQEQVISLADLFQHTSQYRRLAGEMQSQDLAIFRFLLAILTTVYSRYNAHDQPYDWLEIDPETMRPNDFDEDGIDEDAAEDLLTTWQDLYQAGGFSNIVMGYLQCYAGCFDLFSEITPFYQATKKQYDTLVPVTKNVDTGKGTVAVKQINRMISESNNKPDVFSPKSTLHKDEVDLDELARWLITYQNFTAVTDKTKVIAEDNFSVSKGWVYGLNPVFAVSDNLFETLMLNLVLIPQQGEMSIEMLNQRPVWETPLKDYIQLRQKGDFPENIAQLYTTWSRVLHIEWQGYQPTIFSAGLPKLDNENAFLEPMTTWKSDRQDESIKKPDQRWLKSIGKAMWRNFGQYISFQSRQGFEPGIVSWLKLLEANHFIDVKATIRLMTVGLINDGNATSQSPIAEFTDDMQVKAGVLFDDDKSKQNYWPQRIEETVMVTNEIGNYIWRFASNIAKLRGVGNDKDFADRTVGEFYESLNEPFRQWLASLTNQDERDQKVNEWKLKVRSLALTMANNLLKKATPQEIRGKGNDNVFIYYRILTASINKKLDIGGK